MPKWPTWQGCCVMAIARHGRPQAERVLSRSCSVSANDVGFAPGSEGNSMGSNQQVQDVYAVCRADFVVLPTGCGTIPAIPTIPSNTSRQAEKLHLAPRSPLEGKQDRRSRSEGCERQSRVSDTPLPIPPPQGGRGEQASRSLASPGAVRPWRRGRWRAHRAANRTTRRALRRSAPRRATR